MLAPLMLVAGQASAQPSPRRSDGWRDTTRHTAHFVTVQRGVKLHYLDFGGSGPPLVFLAGLGNTAHAFDDFAPAFTDRFRVIAITRRGFGESDHPRDGYDAPRLVADIKAVLDSLKLTRVSFIGHSIAAEEITRFGVTYPARVDKLIFLDGAYDRVRASMLVTDDSVPAPRGESVRSPSRTDTSTEAAYVAYVHRSRGVNIPEGDIRMRFRHDGWQEELGYGYQHISVETPQYRRLKAPSLAIYAVDDASDELYSLLRAQFREQVENGQVLEIHNAHHWIFISHRRQVLAACRKFLGV